MIKFFCPLHPGLIILRRHHHFPLETHPVPLPLLQLFSLRAVSEVSERDLKKDVGILSWEVVGRVRSSKGGRMVRKVTACFGVRDSQCWDSVEGALPVSCIPRPSSGCGLVGRKICFGTRRRKSPESLSYRTRVTTSHL